MVAIVPNRAELEAKILSIIKERGREGFHKMKLQLNVVTLLKGVNTLTDLESGNEVSVLIPTEAVKSKKIKKGLVLYCMIRKASGDDYFIIPDSIRIVSEDSDTPDDH